MDFQVRQVTPADCKRIAEVLHKSFKEYDEVFDPPSGAVSETEASISEKLQACSGYIAVSGGQIVGSVFCNPTPDGAYYLHRLAVLPEFRRLGIGKALIEHVEKEAARMGFGAVQLGTRKAAPQNIAYYEHLGFLHVADIPHRLSLEPVIAVMVKKLGVRH